MKNINGILVFCKQTCSLSLLHTIYNAMLYGYCMSYITSASTRQQEQLCCVNSIFWIKQKQIVQGKEFLRWRFLCLDICINIISMPSMSFLISISAGNYQIQLDLIEVLWFMLYWTRTSFAMASLRLDSPTASFYFIMRTFYILLPYKQQGEGELSRVTERSWAQLSRLCCHREPSWTTAAHVLRFCT